MDYDHVSLNPKSPYYLPPEKSANIGVKLDGKERNADVYEFCVSEGWIKIQLRQNGRVRTERGKVMTIKLRGDVIIYDRRNSQ